MSPLKPDDLRRIFEKLDQNRDGEVSLSELNWLLERIGVRTTLDELESLVGKKGLNLNEFISFYETISDQNLLMVDDEEHEVEEDRESDLEKAFKVFDLNGDGFISCEELQSVLTRLGLWEENSGRDCKAMICVYDTNLDGMLDFEEFKRMMFLTIS